MNGFDIHVHWHGIAVMVSGFVAPLQYRPMADLPPSFFTFWLFHSMADSTPVPG